MVKFIVQHLTQSSYHYLDVAEAKMLADDDRFIKEYEEDFLQEDDAANADVSSPVGGDLDAGDAGGSVEGAAAGANPDGTEDRLKHLQVYGLHIIVSPPSHVTKSTKRLDRFVGH